MNLRFFVSLLVLLIICSCTSLRSYKQRIKLSSSPQGANVYHGDKYLGKTPGYFYLRRARSTKLTLKKKGYKNIEVPIENSYRWGDSFFSNMIWIYFAPVGWLTDVLTGTAWDCDRIPPSEFPTLIKIRTDMPDPIFTPVLAVAPPMAEHELLSSEAGIKIASMIKSAYPDARVLAYGKSEVIFSEHEYSYENKTGDEFLDDLFEKLKITHIAESEVKFEKNNVSIKTDVRNIFTEERENKLKLNYSSDSFTALRGSGTMKQKILKCVEI